MNTCSRCSSTSQVTTHRVHMARLRMYHNDLVWLKNHITCKNSKFVREGREWNYKSYYKDKRILCKAYAKATIDFRSRLNLPSFSLRDNW